MFKILIAMLTVGVTSGQSFAQTVPLTCGPHEGITNFLQENYQETRQLLGLTESGALLEVYAAPNTGTWTILITDPSGLTCAVTAGDNYEEVEESLGGQL